MKDWLRRVTPDLFLAAVIALVITMAVQKFDAIEKQRIIADATALAGDGLTIDERIGVLDESIRRSTMLYLPALAGFGGAAVGLASRRRRWAWLTAIGAIIPALVMGAGFFIDTPLPGGMATATYVLIAVSLATAGVAVRDRFLSPKMSDSHRRSAPSSCALATCENAPNTDGYASAFRKHQSIKILAHLFRRNRSS